MTTTNNTENVETVLTETPIKASKEEDILEKVLTLFEEVKEELINLRTEVELLNQDLTESIANMSLPGSDYRVDEID